MTEDRHILVVDDEMGVRSMVSKWLQKQGYKTQTAEDGLDALEAVSEAKPALIITDFKMPRLNGIEFLAKVWETMPDMPVIFMSAYYQYHDDLSDIHQGKTSFCPKPLDLEDMLAKVKKILESQKDDQNS